MNGQRALSPLISRSNIAIMAITSKMCISEPAEKTKNPKAHPINRITAIK
jgi:hypothetical protein